MRSWLNQWIERTSAPLFSRDTLLVGSFCWKPPVRLHNLKLLKMRPTNKLSFSMMMNIMAAKIFAAVTVTVLAPLGTQSFSCVVNSRGT